jgi:predicted porin
MKKTLLLLSAMGFAGVASAQSSVTIWGILDANIAHGSGTASSKTAVSGSGRNGSRLGFRGTEDLGGGMSAQFWLEAGINVDNGTAGATNTNNQASGTAAAPAGTQGLTFNRRSTVSLAGNWGELRLGRDYTPQYWNLSFDPFGTSGVGGTQTINSIISRPTSVRASNTVGYVLPSSLGGIYGQAQYYLGENSSSAGTPPGATKDDGNGYGARLGFAKGPVDVAVALSRTKYAAGDWHQNNVGAKYDFGLAQLMAHYSFDKDDAVTGGKSRGYLIGGEVPVGVGRIKASYSYYKFDRPTSSPATKRFAIGYDHNLSKRTKIYGTYARLSNSGGAGQSLNGATLANPNDSSRGFDIGLWHTF